jgi:hypothetical protein
MGESTQADNTQFEPENHPTDKSEQDDDVEYMHDIQAWVSEPMRVETNFQPAQVEEEQRDIDPSSIFVPEAVSSRSAPQPSTRLNPSMQTPPPSRPHLPPVLV